VAFAAAIDGMLRACREQAADLKRMPLDTVSRALRLSDEQRTALDKVRSTAQAAAARLDDGCPNGIVAQLSEKLAALDRALPLMVDSLESLRPAPLAAAFENALSEEQRRGIETAIGAHPDNLGNRRPTPSDARQRR
jgi:hypothetical protein